MARTISRRGLFAAAAAGFAAPTALEIGATVAAQTPQRPGSTRLPDVWGQDFLYQWSPPENVTRDLRPGASQLRLSAQVNPRLTAVKDNDYAAFFGNLRAGGWTAVEAASDAWLSRPRPESEIREVKAQAWLNDHSSMRCTARATSLLRIPKRIAGNGTSSTPFTPRRPWAASSS